MNTKKTDHINLALKSQTDVSLNDERFDYEPLMSAFPDGDIMPFGFLGKTMKLPVWISSMTGGSDLSFKINRNLARACGEFGLGMGLGSCRVLLEEDKYYSHFNLREIIGGEYPFYANLGIKQIENAVVNSQTASVVQMVESLKADGLIIHINPLQEWFQPEGEKLTIAPVDTIKSFLSEVNIRVIVKEVGQGFGPESLNELLRLPLEAIELSAFGGTNFAMLELERNNETMKSLLYPVSRVGNRLDQMVSDINAFSDKQPDELQCRSVILSGGISNFLDGYYYMEKCRMKSVYGQASSFLKYARGEYEGLKTFITHQAEGLKLARAYLRIKSSYKG